MKATQIIRTIFDLQVNASLLKDSDEVAVHNATKAASQIVLKSLMDDDFRSAIAALACLRAPLDGFFLRVRVNVPQRDIRENRLALLAEVCLAMGKVADFSQIDA